MYTLKNDQLAVSILDPVEDVARLGSRYCTGGYIWQVTDAQKGKLIAGPEYPKEPNTFDGQGMPDMFIQALGAEEAPVGGEVGCIGVGRVRRTSQEPFDVRYHREVIAFVQWQVKAGEDEVNMQTDAEFKDWAYHLERDVRLEGRAILSRTSISSQGKAPLPVRWFAHPFFPLTEDNALCRFSMPFSLPENPGFFINDEGFVTRKANHDWRKGWFQPVDYHKQRDAMTAVEKHPLVGEVTVTTDFMPAFLPIWGNERTFSFEPYFERELASGQSAAWKIEYRFS